jgi:ATP-dependent RNA helicase DDX49/DBP8
LNPFDTPKAASHSTFASLGLSQPLITALEGINIRKPTEIQSACVEPIMNGQFRTHRSSEDS